MTQNHSGLPDVVLLEFTEKDFRPPTPDEIRLAFGLCLKKNGDKYTGKDIADLLGVNPRTTRRWLSVDPVERRDIPYAAWRLVLVAIGLVPAPDCDERL